MGLRDLFLRRGFPDEPVSLRRSLNTHRPFLGPPPTSAKKAQRLLPELADGDGFERGCRRPEEIQLQFFGKHDMAQVIPAWVSAVDEDPRVVEGILVQSNISSTDFPFWPWHKSYDWNYHLKVDGQYRYLVARNSHTKTPPMRLEGDELVPNTAEKEIQEIFECEWDTAFLPDFAWPQDGNRVWICGRWIYDCGHPEEGLGHRAEIHPPKAVVSFRSEAVSFGGSPAIPARQAVVYIGRRGGYWDQPINDQDFEFDLHLPEKPDVPQAEIVTRVEPRISGGLPVQPIFEPWRPSSPDRLRVRIPLRGVSPHPEEWGAILSCGWKAPGSNQVASVRTHTVTIHTLDKHKKLDKTKRDEWHVFVAVNGRWKKRRLEKSNSNVGHTVAVQLGPEDRIHITACGFESDTVHATMGAESGVAHGTIGRPIPTDQAVEIAKAIRNTGLKTGSKTNENEPLELVSVFHEPGDVGSFEVDSFPNRDYTLHYTIN